MTFLSMLRKCHHDLIIPIFVTALALIPWTIIIDADGISKLAVLATWIASSTWFAFDTWKNAIATFKDRARLEGLDRQIDEQGGELVTRHVQPDGTIRYESTPEMLRRAAKAAGKVPVSEMD